MIRTQNTIEEEYRLLFAITPSIQHMEPPTNPERLIIVKTILLLALILTQGCTSKPVIPFHPSFFVTGNFVDVPGYVNTPTSEAHIGIIRDKSFVDPGIHFWPRIHNSFIAGMLAGEYFEFDIPAMYILIGVACYSSGSDTWKYKDIPLDMAKGEEVYLLIEVNTRKNECADMRIISKTEFLERAQESKEIRVGDVS